MPASYHTDLELKETVHTLHTRETAVAAGGCKGEGLL